MTLPNRASYTPGERRRKFSAAAEGLQSMQGKAPVQDHAGGTPTGNARTRCGGDDILHEELLQVLSGMAPGGTDAATAAWTHARAAEFHKKRMIECKARVEANQQRLYADPCYQQHHSKDESSSFSALLESAAPAESDPLEQLLTGMANDTGLQRGRPSPRLDPQWAALFQQAGAERQQLITNLNKLESGGRNPNPDFDNAMEVLHDAPVRSKYQRAVNNVHEWGKHRLYQQLRAAMFSRGGAGRSSPGSPIESPLRQPPKKRANLSKHAKNVLREWFEEHLHHPYPTEDEKDWLSVQGGITIEQVNNWFINTRGRKWKPMLARIINDKTLGGESKLYDHLVKKIEEPYRG